MQAETTLPPANLMRDWILHGPLQPIVFRGFIKNWKMLSWGIADWTHLFGDERLMFRVGKMRFEQPPQWERECRKEQLTFADFVAWETGRELGMDRSGKSVLSLPRDVWAYFDYKYMHELFGSREDVLKSIDWSAFGFPEHDGSNSTLWIGSQGANTPCHYDLYGCNLVAQLSGRKRWLLFPPSEGKNLCPTRIPYEESSVYSSLGFSTQHLPKHAGQMTLPMAVCLTRPFKMVIGDTCWSVAQPESLMNSQCFSVDLKPGEVLLVPSKWWHYVEHLETAISINTWIPLPADDEGRLGEALVKWLMGMICKTMPPSSSRMVLNPNEDDLLDYPASVLQDYVQSCVKKIQEAKKPVDDEHRVKKVKLTAGDAGPSLGTGSWDSLAAKYEGSVVPVQPQPYQTIWERCYKGVQMPLLSECHTGDNDLMDRHEMCCSILAAFSHPSVIQQVQSVFLQEHLCTLNE